MVNKNYRLIFDILLFRFSGRYFPANINTPEGPASTHFRKWRSATICLLQVNSLQKKPKVFQRIETIQLIKPIFVSVGLFLSVGDFFLVAARRELADTVCPR